MGCCYNLVQVRHATPVVLPVDSDRGEHVYRFHPINVQLVTDPVIMLAKEKQSCYSERLDKHEPRDIFHYHVERHDHSFAVAEKAERLHQEYVFCGIRCSVNNIELSATIMRNSSPPQLVLRLYGVLLKHWSYHWTPSSESRST